MYVRSSTFELDDMENGHKIKISWKMLSIALTSGAKELMGATIIAVLFAIFNLCFVSYIFYHGLRYNASWNIVFPLCITVIVAISFVVWAGHKSYRFGFLRVMNKTYRQTGNYRQEICIEAINRTKKLWDGNIPNDNVKVARAVKWAQLTHQYYQKLPVFFQSGVDHMLMRIPIADLLILVAKDVSIGQDEVAADKLRISIDNLVENYFFSSNKLWWIIWILPLNTLALYAILYWITS